IDGPPGMQYPACMHFAESIPLCAICRKLSLSAVPRQPHALMLLEKVHPPVHWEGILERRYRCTACGAAWLRYTNSCGADTVFEPRSEEHTSELQSLMRN